MSYASAVKDHGPKQSDEEKVPATVPEILHPDSGVHSIDSLSSDTVKIPSYADQQKAEEERAAAEAREAANQVSNDAQGFGKKAESEAQRLQAQTAKKAQQYEKEGEKAYEKAKGEAKDAYGKVKKEVKQDSKEVEREVKKAEVWAEKNRANPVVIGNVVVVGALAALLGTGAYRAHQAGTLTWKVAGAWAGVVGLFAVGDYYVSSYLFKNKYPPKN
ncbi:hypothetical protein EJ03DRAFT_349109 [Teratosphaeria nubilosa]|uniref:Uncharacterized protein n=1 Tax=Teratosphaeria nubilosa TaxID=161662 RepID=A0A6G1LG17_9PEZI|nr:hypothetical protein EJ03DRAFT_349109 [Teratosphaeria nubilosa]